MSFNQVILSGRLGQDPELKELDGGKKVCNFSLATTESWVSSDGTRQEKTSWHRITAWGKTAELISKFWKKGMRAFVICSLSYTERLIGEGDSAKKYMLPVLTVSKVDFSLNSKDKESEE